MFSHITIWQARQRTEEGYCYQYIGDPNEREDTAYQIDEIANWSDEVEMTIFCTPGFFYFESSEDQLNFRLQWC